MANIADLVVQIKARTAGLRKGINNAKARLSKFAKGAVQTLKSIGKKGVVALTASFALLVIGINKSAKSIDLLAKTSDKLGTSVAALQKLQFAANLSGVSTETLNMALQRMVRRVAEAALGTGEAVKALKELGINAATLNKLSPDKQFERVSQAFRKIGTSGDKVRLAMKLFDSEGVALVNTLGLNLQEVGEEFDALGGSITDSQAKAVEAFNDAKLRLGTLGDVFFNQLTVKLATPFTSLIDSVVESIKEMGGLEPVAERTAAFLIDKFQKVIEVFDKLANTIDKIKTVTASIRVGANKVEETFRAAGGLVGIGSEEGQQDFKDRQNRNIDRFDKLFEQQGRNEQDRNDRFSNISNILNKAVSTVEVTIKTDKDTIISDLNVSPNLRGAVKKLNDDTASVAARQTVN